MPDITLPIAEPVSAQKDNGSPAGAGPFVEQANGFIVISKKLATVLPPYRYQYSYDHFDRLGDAHEHYSDLERGEYEGWLPHAILPSLNGVPLGAKVIG